MLPEVLYLWQLGIINKDKRRAGTSLISLHVTIETEEKFPGNTAANQQCQLTCPHYDRKWCHCHVHCLDFTFNLFLVDSWSYFYEMESKKEMSKCLNVRIKKRKATLAGKIKWRAFTYLALTIYDTDQADSYIVYEALLSSLFHSLCLSHIAVIPLGLAQGDPSWRHMTLKH